ncbi:EAL domain-containing protein [Bacillus sp. AGMB 02131]|uniref:EAL domain-containing protein n=1 Tax=Peribacillus faecalis TaxID=2772559 RepID=A0A927CTS4_9BACI|nr:EAL domain-containing protein [Peribacillus faecalis]MBD3107703.1 EAL domain-containing protein [Peribacillus faecalis]
MDTTFTHFIVGHAEMDSIRIIEKVGKHIKELRECICVEELILNKINAEPEFKVLTFEVKVNSALYIFHIHRSFVSGWFDGYIEKKEITDERTQYILNNWEIALQNNEFSLNYQPILNLKSNSCTNVEALIRWKHKEEYISPAVFIPLLEAREQLSQLEYWVIETVFKQICEWQKNDIRIKTHINISNQTLQEDSFLNNFTQLATKYNVSPESIILEITEHSSLTVSESLVSNMTKLAELGVIFAIDDFGAGHTSFSYINTLPISMVKIDKQFIDNGKNNAVLQAIINALNTLNMTIVAEGIETDEMMQQMKWKAIHLIQGYHYSKPVTACQLLPILLKTKLHFKREKANIKHHFSKVKENTYKYRIM